MEKFVVFLVVVVLFLLYLLVTTKLKQSRLEKVVDSIGVFAGLLDSKGRILNTNKTSLDYFNLTKKDLEGIYFWECEWWINSSEKDKIKSYVERAINGEKIEEEAEQTNPDGSINYIEYSLTPVFDCKGNVQYVIPQGKDITALHLAADKLTLANTFWQDTFDAIGDVVFIANRKHRIVRANKKAKEVFGDNVIGSVCHDIMHDDFTHPEEECMFFPKYSKCILDIDEINAYNLEVEDICINDVWYNLSGYPIFDEKGVVTHVVHVLTNITVYRESQVAINQSKQRLESLFTLSQMQESSEQELADFALEAAIKITGSTIGYLHFVDDDVPMHVCGWSGGDCDVCSFPMYTPNMSGLKEGQYDQVLIDNEYCMDVNKPNDCPINRHMRIPIIESGNLVAVAGVCNKEEDYTQIDVHELTLFVNNMWGIIKNKKLLEEKLAMEESLYQVRKMQAIGTLAGGIAHDFNNLLMVILGYAQLMKTKLEKEDEFYQNLSQIIIAGNRARDLVKQILTFSRYNDDTMVPMILGPTLKETLKMLRSSLPTSVDIVQDIPDDIKPVISDPTRIHQILTNLATNAVHAMEEKGVLTVKLENYNLENDSVARILNLPKGNYVKLTVSDTGSGISQEHKQRIFDPFFTTKTVGKGTGIGLSVVHGSVKDMGGCIDMETVEGEGTTFYIYLPVTDLELQYEEEVKQKKKFSGNERVIVVDDEPMVADIATQYLENMGYKVSTFNNSVAAWDAIQKEPDGFDLLITDQSMPNITGVDLVQKARNLRPDLPTIICTGYSSSIDEKMAKHLGIDGFIMKPMTMENISNVVRKALNGKKKN